MQRNLLDLQALRQLSTPYLQHGAPAAQGPLLTRRELLTAAGAAAVSSTPVFGTVAGLTGSFELVGGPDRAVFRVDGQDRWTIDPERFAGSPRFSIDRSPGLIRLKLEGARYPGTDLPADMTCELRQVGAGHRMKLWMALGSFNGQAPFEEWLWGRESLQSAINLSNTAWKGDPEYHLILQGAADATFGPDWALWMQGEQIGRLRVPTGEWISDSVTLSLLTPPERSLLDQYPARRSLIRMDRGPNDWTFHPSISTPGSSRLLVEDNAFHSVRIESGEDADGESAHALAADSSGAGTKFRFQPGTSFCNGHGEPFHLSLQMARYAVAFTPDGRQTGVVANHEEAEPAWLHAGGCSVLIGPSSQPFEWVQSGTTQTLRCEPALHGVAAPLPGVIVEVAAKPEARVRFAAEGSTVAAPVLAAAVGRENPIRLVPTIRPAVPIITPNGGNIRINPGLSLILPGLNVTVLRPWDMLNLTFDFINLNLQAGETSRLVRADAAKPAYIVAHFAPQNIEEQTFPEAESEANSVTPAQPPIQSRLSGPSRLAFKIPDEMTEVPYSLLALLDWKRYEPSVTPAANALREILPVKPALPARWQTAIECPYRLIVSPNMFSAWAHRIFPGAEEGRTELWHTRFGVLDSPRDAPATVDEDPAHESQRTLRAVWSPDYTAGVSTNAQAPPVPNPSLTPENRSDLVALTSDFSLAGAQNRVIQVEQLMLTSLGAWMKVYTKGDWDHPEFGLKLLFWRHQAAMGRDHYVKVVERGYLFPFGHRAAQITVTERKFQKTPDGAVAAYLRQRKYIVVREPEKIFRNSGWLTADGASMDRMMPFRRVRITTLVTPDLDPVNGGTQLGDTPFPNYIVLPQVGGQDFLFHLVAEDTSGLQSEFTSPLVFVPPGARGAYQQEMMNTLTAAWDKSGKGGRRFSGQKVALAESQKPGDTSFDANILTFGAAVPSRQIIGDAALMKADQPRFYPVMHSANLKIPAVQQLLGSSQSPTIHFHDIYLQQGFDPGANKGNIFLELDAPSLLAFPADKSGGLVKPDFAISGISRALGPVGGDLKVLAAGTFDPKEFFKATLDGVKILGGISVADIIGAGDLSNAPALVTQKLPDEQHPTQIKTILNWQTSNLTKETIFVPRDGTQLVIRTQVITHIPTAGAPALEPTVDVLGQLHNFDLNFFALITVPFDLLQFHVAAGQKMDVTAAVNTKGVLFGGVLSFINVLAQLIPPGGFSDPPSLDVSPSGIKVGYTLALPTLAAGAYSFQNMKIGAALNIPFTGEPVRLRFSFGERHDPFLVSAFILTGGGFFGLAIGLDGIETLEASFELGGSIEFSVAVASGGVYIMLGIYFQLTTADHEVDLTGYVRAGGALEVLDLITISIELYMGLTYEIGPNKVQGEASVTAEVDVLFFSKSVSFDVKKEFDAPAVVGSAVGAVASLPGSEEWSFGNSIHPEPAHLTLAAHEEHWRNYLEAFAC